MPLTLADYINSLDERSDLIWPTPPPAAPIKVTPFLQPLEGIRAVTWNVYGTLLRIDQGQLMHLHPQQLRMQVALEKTIKEFNMWYSMSRKPGQPWEYMLRQYSDMIEEARMAGTKKKGDVPEVNSSKVWHKILDRLLKNEYQWDKGQLGDVDALADKVAYFFHASLQGTEAAPFAVETLAELTRQGIRQGLLADGQAFTLPQLQRDFRRQGHFDRLGQVLASDCVVLSTQWGLRKPSPSLYAAAVESFKKQGISPSQVLHVSHILQEDLAVAKKAGFHTCLYVADKNTCRFEAADVRNPEWKPDRLIADIRQIRDIVGA